MIKLTESLASLIFGLDKHYASDRSLIFDIISKIREAHETDADIHQLLDDYYKDLPNSITMAMTHRLVKKQKQIDELKQPLDINVLLKNNQNSETDYTLLLIKKIEDSLVKTIDRHHERIKELNNVDGYALDIYPWHADIDFSVRGQSIKKEYRNDPSEWGDAGGKDGEVFFNNEIPDFTWFVEYLEKTHINLNISEDTRKRKAWDQWVRICIALAMMGDTFKQVLKKYFFTHVSDDRSYLGTYYVNAGSESGMGDGYNYINYINSLRIGMGGEVDIEEIKRLHNWCIVPLDDA